ncbi:MAG: polysaccharide deacetylase family protein [Gemmatimonadaceae bacterium]|nr:polysaccharide deacetylase family protein [Gemmatimonadaceae bacterium]
MTVPRLQSVAPPLSPAGPASETATVVIFWDYDTQWGADRSRNRSAIADWGHREFPNTERVLELHARYDIPACFAVVGAAARPGERPYHDPAQIRRIHAAGHEVASHSLEHEWLPALGPDALRRTLRESKDALEQCIGAEVRTFVPPFNQPFDYASRWAFSLSERLSVRGPRTDLGRLCAALRETGYTFCRVAYQPLGERLAELVTRRSVDRPARVESIAGVRCLRLNTQGGFDEPVRRAIAARLDRGGYWVVYGHPHSAGDEPGPQSLRMLEGMLALIDQWRRDGRVRCALPRDIVHHQERLDGPRHR